MSSLSGPVVKTSSDATALYVNKFVKEDVDTPDEAQSVDFRRWKEKRMLEYDSAAAARKKEMADEARREADRRALWRVKEFAWQCCIDSDHRDRNKYPKASSFAINAGQTFQNVIRARLISLEFPNVLNVINRSNCTLTWINQEDVDLGYPPYSISIPTGNYNYRTLEVQLNEMLHSSNLKRRNGMGTPHFFVVRLDGDTDRVSFSSIIPQATSENPIQTIKDTNRVRVSAPNHGFVTGDTVRVLGAQGSLGGISSFELNGTFTVTVPNSNFFEYEIANVARGASSNLSGGGKSVQVGKEAPFQFTFQNDSTSASRLLGFPQENSSVNIPDSYIQTFCIDIVEVYTGETTIIVAPDHNLERGDRIYLNNFVVTPSIYSSSAHRGEIYVHRVISPDVFEIDFATTRITDISLAFIGTRLVTMFLPGHGFNRIVAFSGTVIETLFPSNVKLGDNIFVKCPLGKKANFSGAFRVMEIVDDDKFMVSPILQTDGLGILSVTLVDDGSALITTNSTHTYQSGAVATLTAVNLSLPLNQTTFVVRKAISETSFTVSVAGRQPGTFDFPNITVNDGTILAHQNFTLYNASSVGGLTERDLNSTPFSVRKILSPDLFVFSTRTGFSTHMDRGSENMRINSLVMGWRGTQTNTQATGHVYSPIALTGDSYCFLRVPSLGKHSTIINTGGVSNILGKVQLTAPPVTTLFNTAVSGSLEFRDGPLPTLSTIDFQWVDRKGNEVDFGHFQWSCVLEIVTLTTFNEENFQPVKVYLPDPVERIHWARGASSRQEDC